MKTELGKLGMWMCVLGFVGGVSAEGSKKEKTRAPAQNAVGLCANSRKPHWEKRVGVWISNVDSDFFKSRDQIRSRLHALKDLGVTEIYPVVWNKGAFLYALSPELQKKWGISPYRDASWKGRDLLREVLEESRILNLKVFAWLEMGLKLPVEMALVKDHPQWFLKNLSGQNQAIEGGKQLARWNPLNPEVQDLFAQTLRHLVENYSLDGIQMDDHFAFAREWGYDDGIVQRYRKETGRLPPRTLPSDHAPPNDPLFKVWAPWMRWKADRLNAFMGELTQVIRAAARSPLKIQVAPNSYPWSLNVLGQDWPEWIRQGWVDEVVAQVYRTGEENYSFELRNPGIVQAKNCVPVLIGVYAGQKGRVVPTDRVLWQMGLVRDFAFTGVSFFNAETLFQGSEAPEERVRVLKEYLKNSSE